MAAHKFSNTDIQHDLSEAQQCKCENRCVNCFKLQSELHEVRLELKSVRETVNILNRDLDSINMRGHNLHEQESSHIATQLFENWPLRHSTKKSYSEVTANKPYTVTKNHFQLLDNLQENDSPVDVLCEFPQPQKIYHSAVRARSACVKAERQVTRKYRQNSFP